MSHYTQSMLFTTTPCCVIRGTMGFSRTLAYLTTRATPPHAILREVWLRTGDRPFTRIEDVIDVSELRAISERYKEVAGL
jgi:hypothetical protein